ncbi:PREDICTED: uncharacterized protein LOC107336211 [Acropora digitifera]|uniref:uncharacterized protein LOC107336211 n=1 Tax=Acropora digitifera TaxID=70779 RepID=UPI00077A1B35|nr:PREDICTED: uncharacterized protein LOC107336211 [Acropora digitifera]
MASCSRQPQEHDRTIKVTILASEWGSSKGGLSTINRELAIQLAKSHDVKVTFFLPKCSLEGKEEAKYHGISIVEAERQPGFEELDWLSFLPQDLQVDVVVGHGVKLGRHAQVICKSHKCKWIQVVHTDPEKLGMFKCYENPISKGEQKHHVEVELCQMSDLVVGVGPKLTEAFRKYLRWCKTDQDVFQFTPSVFADFASVEHALDERKPRSVLVFGRGDYEDFELKGFDIAARSVATLPDTDLVFVGAPDGKEQEIAKRLLDCGIPKGHLTVRGFKDREALKRLFCEVDLVLMPSRTEGFGLTGLEALSAGLPVIVTKNSGFGEALGSVPFGSSFVIDSEDSIAWTAAIKGIWNKDRQTRLDETKVLRDSYGKRYSWSEQCENLIEKMVSLLENRQDASRRPQMSVQDRRETRGAFIEDRTDASGRLKMPVQDPRERRGASNEDRTGFSSARNGLNTRLLRLLGRPLFRKKVIAFTISALSSELGEVIILKRQKAGVSHSRRVIEWIQQIYAKREGVIWPLPWCDSFNFQLENIYTRLSIVAKGKACRKVTNEVTRITSIFTAHEDCKRPKVVLIEGEPGSGKTTYCRKLAYDWATRQGCKWDKSFPRVEVLLLLRCHEIKSSIWEAIDEQILPKDIEPEERDVFIQFLRENPSKDLKGILPNSRTKLYIEIVLFVLRRYENKSGLSISDKDLLLVYKKELMILGKVALDSLQKGELYFEDHKDDLKESLLGKLGFVSIQVGAPEFGFTLYGRMQSFFRNRVHGISPFTW